MGFGQSTQRRTFGVNRPSTSSGVGSIAPFGRMSSTAKGVTPCPPIREKPAALWFPHQRAAGNATEENPSRSAASPSDRAARTRHPGAASRSPAASYRPDCGGALGRLAVCGERGVLRSWAAALPAAAGGGAAGEFGIGRARSPARPGLRSGIVDTAARTTGARGPSRGCRRGHASCRCSTGRRLQDRQRHVVALS